MAQGPGKASLIWRFFVIFLLHSISIFFFTRGFLLTRTELATYSNCSDVSQSPCGPPPVENLTRFGNDGSSQCWTRPVVDRVVIIVLDALRFDFVAPSTFFEEARPWMDKLQVLQKLAAEEGTSARIFKAIADPPTTSLQRLKTRFIDEGSSISGLTTGGLPTFIDVGNSFGAPAILEDNLIHQLARNGKRVLMMGDDTWLQLFPDHFQKCYPFPSFNVKDLHTVDDGCVDHLLPSLYLDDWDVLIAHFLGVDHAGHIYGADSSPMVEKLEQYNNILEKVVEVLKNLSGPGGSHENTLLLVMGDHGQTLNGDHGGGTTEEVETSLFAMSLKEPSPSISSVFDASSCRSSEDGREICFSTFQQLDFAATLAALVGIPFPFGSIGRVNPELYALGAGTWKGASTNASNCRSCSELEDWMHNYANVLCMNCWQVKRYIEQYSVSSAIGFPKGDLLSIEELYTNVQDNYTNNVNEELLFDSESLIGSHENISSILRQQINAYSRFLEKVADLARSKWTEFDIKEMGVGLFILLLSLIFHLFAIRGVTGPLLKSGHFKKEYTAFSIFSILMVAIRACSFLSNSYILTEGKVAIFLLATSGILIARFAFMNGKMRAEAVVFLLLNFIVGLNASHGPLKQSVTSAPANPIWALIFDVAPILVLVTLSIILCKSVSRSSYWGFLRYIVIVGTILSYVIIAANWVLESNVLSTTFVFDGFGRNYMPQMVYAIGFGLLVLLLLHKSFSKKDKICNFEEATVLATVCMLSVWSPTLVILLGRQGPLVVLVFTLGVWCITKLQNMANEMIGSRSTGVLSNNPLSVAQWSLLGVCLFFYSGHWCTFDGLRYGAAFVGFDDFNLIRQGILLAIDTFGVSHILPIFGLPFLVASQSSVFHGRQMKGAFYYKLTEVFLIYGLTTAVTATFTIICVTIQRRHLMVWGLFAPKFVFDALGLLLTDILICVASLYYY